MYDALGWSKTQQVAQPLRPGQQGAALAEIFPRRGDSAGRLTPPPPSPVLTGHVSSSPPRTKRTRQTHASPRDWAPAGTGELTPDRCQGVALGAFFDGYITTQIAGGVLARRIGGTAVLGGGMLLASLCTALTPVVAWTFPLLVVRAPPPPRTNRTRRVPHPVLIGHAASLTPY